MVDNIKSIYRVFEPEPLSIDDIDLYVPLDDVRGSSGLVSKLSKTIRYSANPTCQLLAGHIGSGKSTELRRLQQDLEGGKEKFFTVFCTILQDIDVEDTDFPDILIGILRQAAYQLNDRCKIKLKPGYFKQRWDELKNVLGGDVSFTGVDLSVGLANISAVIKSSPNTRLEIRKRLEPKLNTWIEAAKDVISKAVLELKKKGFASLVIIADDMDKLSVERRQDIDGSTAERLFIHRYAQLTALNCHVVYTIPLSLAYSCKERDIASLYNLTAPPVVPMTKVVDENGTRFEAGFEKFRDVISKRLKKAGAKESIFESEEVKDRIIEYSAGQPRVLMTLIRDSIIEADLPITLSAVENVARKIVQSYARQLREEHWTIIRQVKKDHALKRSQKNDSLCMELLANRAILQYLNEKEWYGLNPLLPKHRT
jgi:hypothetical protein